MRYLDGEGGPLEVSKNQPLDHNVERGNDGFDDFLHSYPSSSMEKPEEDYPFSVSDVPSTSPVSLLPFSVDWGEGRD